MKKQKNIFISFLTSAVVAFCLMPSAFAAADTSCDNEDNEYINQRLALCSVHAYNIGATENPTDIAQQQAMKDVVALKTTVMTQQMKKQFDFLEVTVRRFKTQLEKAILVSKMEAAGAGSESSSSGQSTNKNIMLSGAQDCNTVYSNADLLTCLGNNLNMIASSGDRTNSRKQLESDLKLFDALASAENKTTKCASLSTSTMNDCITEYRIKIRSQASAATQRTNIGGGGYMMITQ